MTDTPTRGGPQHIPRPADWEPGPPAPWSGPSDALSVDTVRRVLRDGPAPRPSPAEGSSAGASSVLVPLYEHEDRVWVVLTRRAWHLRSHTGEVSFPGGRREAIDDDLWATATREAWEEIDLDPGAVEQIGELHHLATVSSRSFIVPFVGVLDGRPELTRNHDEVDAILHVPLAELLDPAIYRQELWRWEGLQRPIHFFELVGDTVWGATGSMLVDLLTRIAGD